MEVKRAGVEDLDSVTDLFDLYRQFYEQASDLEGARGFLLERLTQNESVIFLATDNAESMGFAQAYPAFSSVSMRRTWILNDLYVRKEHRGKGIGEALLQHVLNFAKDTGTKGVLLETGEDNVAAQRLYEKVGFEREANRFYFYTVKA